jgi:hypothetical protein
MQSIIDLVNNAAKGMSIAPQSVTTNLNGTALDLNNGINACNALIDVGAMTGTTFDVILEESATSNGTFTTITSTTITSGSQQLAIRGQRNLQYARARVANANVTTVLLAVDIIEQSKYEPRSGGYDRSPSS